MGLLRLWSFYQEGEKKRRKKELSTILFKLIMRSGINLKTFKFKIDEHLFIPDVKEVFTIQPGLSNLTKFEGYMSAFISKSNDKIFKVFELIPLYSTFPSEIEIANID